MTGFGSDQTRGFRNNNPLNIRYSAHNLWKGRVANKLDNEFEEFVSMKYGLRAAIINLRTYFSKYKRDTLRQIIFAWAPPSENQTDSYLKYVSQATGLDPDEKLFFEKKTIFKIVKSMAKIESRFILSKSDFDVAWQLI